MEDAATKWCVGRHTMPNDGGTVHVSIESYGGGNVNLILRMLVNGGGLMC